MRVRHPGRSLSPDFGGAAVGLDPKDEQERRELEHLATRLQELNNSSTQVLLFLSFAIVGAVTYLAISLDPARKLAVHSALHWWIGAIFPTLSCIVPLKELGDRNIRWYRSIMWLRFVLLWAAIVCIFIGALQFLRAI